MIFKNIHIHQVLISLIIGAVLGAWGIQLLDEGCGMGSPHKDAMRQRMIKKMERELTLDQEQKKQLETIFKVMQPRMKALRKEMRPKYKAMLEDTRNQIREILKPEQIAQFEKINQKMDERWKKYREKRSQREN